MSVDVNDLKSSFADERWKIYLQQEYMIRTPGRDDKSSYSTKERNLDRYLLIDLLEGCLECDLEKIKILQSDS